MPSARYVVATRNVPRATINHRSSVMSGTVLDAVDAALDGRPDRFVAVAVRHLEAGAWLVGDRQQLLGGVLPCTGRTGARITPPEALTLMTRGSVLDLVADGLTDLGHPVGDPLYRER